MTCQHCNAHINETDERCPYCNSYNENYKKPKTTKSAEIDASVPVSKVIHVYHSGKKPQKKWVKILKRVILSLILTGVGVFVTIASIRFIIFLFFV